MYDPVLACASAVWLVMTGVQRLSIWKTELWPIVNSDLIMMSEVKRELEPERERLAKHHRGDELAQRLKTAE